MDTSGVTNATQAVIESTTTLTDDLNENIVLIEPGPKISDAGKQIQDYVKSECDQIDGSAKIMFENGNGAF